MLENKYKQITISEHISLYDKIIPKDHFLRKLKENVDFSFVNKLVEKEYCETFGRPAKEPEVLFKLLFLQTKDLLSDREVIKRAETDMAYKFFLDINPEDRIITGLEVTTGEAPDGKYMETLVEKSKKAGITVKEIIGDRAYSGRDNLQYGKENEIKIISRLNPIISNSKNMKDGFEYIKDADILRCPAGHLAARKQYRAECVKKDGVKRNATMEYTFDKQKCENCIYRERCKISNTKNKTYMISIPSNIHKEQQEFEETEYFKNKIRYERYKIEAKNGEIKQAHGLCKVRYMGLSKVRLQSYLTCIVANIKRTIKIMEQVEA